jgi:hypothetical protein
VAFPETLAGAMLLALSVVLEAVGIRLERRHGG